MIGNEITNKINLELYLAYKDTENEMEKRRKEAASMLYCFYQGNLAEIKHYMEQQMRNSSVKNNYIFNPDKNAFDMLPGEGIGIFDEDTVRIFPKRHYDLVNKTLNIICRPYKADRYLVNEKGDVDEEATNLLLEIYENANFDIVSSEFYKQAKFFNTVLVEPVWREELEFDIHTPNFVTVKPKCNNIHRIEALWIDREIEYNGSTHTGYAFWSNDEHYYELADGTIRAVEGNEEKVNPYGIIPHEVLRFKKSSDFWGEPWQDLVENNIWYNIRENNLLFVEMFQGLGVGVGVNLGKNGRLSIKPNTIISVDGVRGDDIAAPSLTFSSTGAPITELSINADKDYRRVGNTKGLSSQAFSNDTGSEQSGRSKKFDNAELDGIVQDNMSKLKIFEKNLFAKVRKVYNLHNKSKRIDDKLKFVIKIIEEEPTLTVDEEIKYWKFELDNGLSSKVDYLIAKNPALTEREAVKQLEQIKNYNEQHKAGEGKEKPGSKTDGNADNAEASADTGQ